MKFLPAALLIFLSSTLLAQDLSKDLTPESAALIKEGRRWKVNSIMTGQHDPELQKLAEEHARWMANNTSLGHQNFMSRAGRLFRKRYNDPSEICSASWSGQSLSEGSYDAFLSWKSSKAHWNSVQRKGIRYGYALVKGRDNKWYACGLFARKEK